MTEKHYISKEKFEDLQKEHEELRTIKRKEVAERLEHARSLGDLSENAEYHEARDDQAELEKRIEQIAEILKNAEIIAPHKSDKVEVGSTVVLQKKGGDKVTYQIVGSEESDLASGKISYESPLGRALMGKMKKDAFVFETPKGKSDYVVVDIK
jgi:transcription elongation factor GreA